MLSKKWLAGLAVASASVMLAACGGGGGGSSGDVISGTAASGAALVGGTVSLTCANGAKLSGSTDASGKYSTGSATLAYPCVGTVTKGSLSYRTILFSGTVANFTPITELLVTVVLAAAGESSVDSLISRAANSVFAQSITGSVQVYRNATVNALKNLGVDTTLLTTTFTNFESVVFNADRTGFDKLLEDSKAVVQNDDGSVKSTVTDEAKKEGAKLPKPTGASGASGAN
jgi:hypothetical protein